MLKSKHTNKLIDELIDICLEIEQYDCGNSLPPKSWTVQDLKRRGIRYVKVLEERTLGEYRFEELFEAVSFLPFNKLDLDMWWS